MTAVLTVSLCLVCDQPLDVPLDSDKGEIVECAACGQEHEVVEYSKDAVRVELAPEIEEDWGE